MVASLLLQGVLPVRARMAGQYKSAKGSQGVIGIEKSFPVYKDAAFCGASAILLGGWCWPIYLCPQIQDEMYELADELLEKTLGRNKYRLADRNVKRIGYYNTEPTLKLSLKVNKG